MVEVKIYSPIASSDDALFFEAFGIEDTVFSADTVVKLFANNSQESDFKFNIRCPGGSTYEGLAIYDLLRTSGKNIYMNIEDGCHSMAIVLLLAAPYENRTANRNCRSLIHEVRTNMCDEVTAEELIGIAENIKQEQNAILDIYAERTTTDRATLETIMREEKMRTAQDLLNWGFISKINGYNTNTYKPQKREIMSKKQDLISQADGLLGKLKNFLAGTPETVNFDFADADGNVMFSTEKEDDSLEVGDTATPDGTFTLPDGRTVVIAEGVVESIDEAETPEEAIENLRAENADLRQQLETQTAMRNLLAEAQTTVSNLKKQVTSNYTPTPRVNNPKGGDSGAGRKNEIREKLKK